jgi:hypothetical protein
MSYLDDLSESLVLGELLTRLVKRYGAFELVAHWMQGEFHHDVVLRVRVPEGLGDASILVVATNCNAGVKELLAFDEVPSRAALWDFRLGDRNGRSIGLRGVARTVHWFDPRELLGENARSELKPEYRRRQSGGGWTLRDDLTCGTPRPN